MKSNLIGKRIVQLDLVDSTNNFAAKAYKNNEIDSGTVILAGIQTNGRGQRGNIWQSEPFENILMSFPLDLTFFANLSPVSINHLVSLSLYHFLVDYSDDVKIKWPNDLLIGNNKIAGILIENQLEGNRFKSTIVGIGLNMNQRQFDHPKVTSLALESNQTFQQSDIVAAIVFHLNEQFSAAQLQTAEKIRAEYNSRLWKKGIETTYIHGNKTHIGTILGSDWDGGLIVQVDNVEKKYYTGEVSFLERA